MIERQLAVEIAAMELVEQALDQPEAQRAVFVAGAAHPMRIRQTALRLLRRVDEPDYWQLFGGPAAHARPHRHRAVSR